MNFIRAPKLDFAALLFNSYVFLLLFLPVVFAGFCLLARSGRARWTLGWLTLASLVFYGAWSPAFLALLVGSIVFNHRAACAIAAQAGRRRGGVLLGLAVAADLALLGVFKYTNFFIGSVASLTGLQLALVDIVLPVGISFFTFTQIAYLVDVRRGLASDLRFDRYVLFVTWFPHLVAGPVIHHAQVMPQFDGACSRAPRSHDVAQGLALFALGLAKKVLLADSLAEYATPAFDAAAAGHTPSMLAAWAGALAYALQLYFDFSGYSDMACGLSRMFGVRLPINFDSPYRAWNIIEFWRRWHMTLSRFLRDYLYIPLGGNRRGAARRHLNLMVTMLLGGLWHGANWTFVLWGAAHGAMLLVNHAWQSLRLRLGLPARRRPSGLGRVVGTALTFLAVVVAWVPFRAQDVGSAGRMLAGMTDLSSLPAWATWSQAWLDWPARAWARFLAGHPATLADLQGAAPWPLLMLALAVVMFAPSAVRWVGARAAQIEPGAEAAVPVPRRWRWQPRWPWALLIGALLGLSLLNLSRVSPFLYFQF